MKAINFIFFIITLPIFFTACDINNRHKAALTAVDGIIDSSPDSALLMLGKIDIQDNEQENVAMYNLLLTQARYICYLPVTSDTLINVSIDFYRRKKNTALLARSLYYKGATIYDLDRKEEAMKCLKEAEMLATNIKDEFLLEKIYQRIGFIYSELGYKEQDLKYSKLSYNLALLQKDKDVICNSFNDVAVAYYHCGYKDSCLIFLKQALKRLPPSDNDTKAFIYANIGQLYLDNCDFTSAKHYFDKSVKTYELPYVYNNIGELLQKTGNPDSAFVLWNKVVKTGDANDKISAYGFIKQYYKDNGLYKEALKINDSIKILEDSLNKHSIKIAEIQAEYDENGKNRKTIEKYGFVIYAVIIICIIAICCVFIFYKKNKKDNESIISNRHRALAENKKELAATMAEMKNLANDCTKYKNRINDCEKKIESLNSDNEKYEGELIDKRKQLECLIKKLNILEQRKNDLETSFNDYKTRIKILEQIKVKQLKKGHKIFEEIREGKIKSIARLSDEEIDILICYYRSVDFESPENFIYDKHKRRQELFFILNKLGFDTERIATFMCISSSAVRSMRSRVRKRQN